MSWRSPSAAKRTAPFGFVSAATAGANTDEPTRARTAGSNSSRRRRVGSVTENLSSNGGTRWVGWVDGADGVDGILVRRGRGEKAATGQGSVGSHPIEPPAPAQLRRGR